MSNNLLTMIPSVEPDELIYLQQITNGLTDDKLKLFVTIYNGKRKNAEVILLCCLLGFVCCAGVQRFLIGQIGMGILYLFTGGLCLIGTIVDVINHKQLALEFNMLKANEAMAMINSF